LLIMAAIWNGPANPGKNNAPCNGLPSDAALPVSESFPIVVDEGLQNAYATSGAQCKC
jgi:hypothetical protein